jgi:S1-C subfamily serine protease
MKRASLYSSSARGRPARPPVVPAPGSTDAPSEGATTAPRRTPGRFARFVKRRAGPLLAAGGALFALMLVALHGAMSPGTRQLTQRDIDAAVLRTLETKPMPSRAAEAYDLIRHSIVRVRSLGGADDADRDEERSVGSGVVILDDGTILTNLHVVAGAKRIGVIFSDGHESDATVVGTRPEHDLAVIRATSVPDDLAAATLRSTADLRLGDEVVAVGFPFGIGPSVSSGVISGLRREYQSPEGKRLLTNLIQFDAAANPGSSGGPLMTTDGEVVGIVTGILNPNKEPVFIGIGFAVPIENAAAAAGLSPF